MQDQQEETEATEVFVPPFSPLPPVRRERLELQMDSFVGREGTQRSQRLSNLQTDWEEHGKARN